MDVSLRHLRYFVAVAEAGSVTRAADRIHIAQQVLSRQISQLEGAVGAVLFERTARGVTLTAAGNALLDAAGPALAGVDNAVALARRAANRLPGQLSVGLHVAASGDVVTSLLARMTQHHPQVDVMLRTFELDHPAAGLLDGSSDVAFIRSPIAAAGLESVLLHSEGRVFVLPAVHPLAARQFLTMTDVAGHPWVAAARACDGSPPMTWRNAWLLDPRPDGDHPIVGAVAATLDEWRELVAAGRGISLCPASAERYYARPGIAFVPAVGVPEAEVRLAWRAGDRPPAVTELLALTAFTAIGIAATADTAVG